MLTHQYAQHDWSPLVWAEGLATLATLVVVGLCVFLLGATRAMRARHDEVSETQERPRLDAGAARPARL